MHTFTATADDGGARVAVPAEGKMRVRRRWLGWWGLGMTAASYVHMSWLDPRGGAVVEGGKGGCDDEKEGAKGWWCSSWGSMAPFKVGYKDGIGWKSDDRKGEGGGCSVYGGCDGLGVQFGG